MPCSLDAFGHLDPAGADALAQLYAPDTVDAVCG